MDGSARERIRLKATRVLSSSVYRGFIGSDVHPDVAGFQPMASQPRGSLPLRRSLLDTNSTALHHGGASEPVRSARRPACQRLPTHGRGVLGTSQVRWLQRGASYRCISGMHSSHDVGVSTATATALENRFLETQPEVTVKDDVDARIDRAVGVTEEQAKEKVLGRERALRVDDVASDEVYIVGQPTQHEDDDDGDQHDEHALFGLDFQLLIGRCDVSRDLTHPNAVNNARVKRQNDHERNGVQEAEQRQRVVFRRCVRVERKGPFLNAERCTVHEFHRRDAQNRRDERKRR